jgi:hypothetical protein
MIPGRLKPLVDMQNGIIYVNMSTNNNIAERQSFSFCISQNMKFSQTELKFKYFLENWQMYLVNKIWDQLWT